MIGRGCRGITVAMGCPLAEMLTAPSWALPYFVGCGIAFALILVWLGERLATRSLLPVIGLAALISPLWPMLIWPAGVVAVRRLRHRWPRRARVQYRHIVRLLLRREARLRRAGDAIYRTSAARLAERTACTRRTIAAAGVASATSPLTRYCSRCRRTVPITAHYCTRCGRKLDA